MSNLRDGNLQIFALYVRFNIRYSPSDLIAMKAHFKILVCITFGLISLIACNHQTQWENESAQILSRITFLEQKQQVLNHRIDSLWDVTTAELEKNLPESMPPVDRNIFLNARNADHIRMFSSFELLDPKTQKVINRAGEYDKLLAGQVHDLFEERRQLEQLRNSFLKKVAESDTKASIEYAYKFRNTAQQLNMQ